MLQTLMYSHYLQSLCFLDTQFSGYSWKVIILTNAIAVQRSNLLMTFCIIWPQQLGAYTKVLVDLQRRFQAEELCLCSIMLTVSAKPNRLALRTAKWGILCLYWGLLKMWPMPYLFRQRHTWPRHSFLRQSHRDQAPSLSHSVQAD